MKKIFVLGLVLGSLSLNASDFKINSCLNCHGTNFEKKALGKSKIVKNMSEIEISKALKGYKEETYGGTMKGIMRSQIAKYSEKELKNIAKSVFKLNNNKIDIINLNKGNSDKG